MEMLLAYLPQLALVSALTLTERLRDRARTDWWINVQAWLVAITVALTILPAFHLFGIPSLLNGAALPFWIGFPLFLVVRDFGEFLYHRAQHRIPLLWAMHSLHHSDPEMSALTTERHFWGDQLIKNVTIWAAASMVIAPTMAIIAAFSLVSLWHYVSHSRLPLDLGRWSWLINTPAYHRRHHSSLPEHYGSNFAALFPIFDVIFGSYNRPQGFPPTGLDSAPRNLREIVLWPLHFVRPARQPAISEA